MDGAWRTIRASVAAILISAGLISSWLALPRTVAACSCATSSLAEFAKFPGASVFVGTVGKVDPVGLPVAVDTWFRGPGAAPIVHLDASDLGSQSSSCGIPVPPPGARYIFASTPAGPGGLLGLGLCNPYGDVSGPDGQALLAEAERAFPNPQVVPRPASTAAAPTDPVSTISAVAPIMMVGLGALVCLGLVVLVVVIGRRLRASD